jgi:asparagine synthase (glutamine-hydrolysing)
MQTSDGRASTYNGEIYNHRQLRGDLEAFGVRFCTTSDTEVLVEAWARWGDQALQRIRGIFAFETYDTFGCSTTLVCNPLGIKPLYFSTTGAGDLPKGLRLRLGGSSPLPSHWLGD